MDQVGRGENVSYCVSSPAPARGSRLPGKALYRTAPAGAGRPPLHLRIAGQGQGLLWRLPRKCSFRAKQMGEGGAPGVLAVSPVVMALGAL